MSRLFSAVFTRDLGFFTLGLLAVLVVAGHFVWLYQRRHGDVDHGYARGVGQGVWIATATALAGDLGEGAPNRLDKALAAAVPEAAALSRSRLMRMIAEGAVFRGGLAVVMLGHVSS